jgi:hypothetical protein
MSLLGLGIRSVEYARDGGVDGVPLVEQASEDLFAIGREAVEALVAFVFFAPLAGEKSLGFEAAEKRIERAFVDLKTALGQLFAERVAVVFLPELGQDGQGEAAAAELKAKIFERVVSCCHCSCPYTAVPHTLYFIYCMTTSVRRQVVFEKRFCECRVR